MADTDAAAQAPEGRLIILPVDLDEASVTAVSWAARHVLRNGARSMTYCSLCDVARRGGMRVRIALLASTALGSWMVPLGRSARLSRVLLAAAYSAAAMRGGACRALTSTACLEGDSALLLHVIPSTYPMLEPALGLGGEGVFTSVPDPEAEQLRVRLVVSMLALLCTHLAPLASSLDSREMT